MVYSALSDSTTRSQFTRRKDITITTDGTSTPSNYQQKLTITYEPEMQADFDDIRFNTRDGDYIDYWIESHTASTTATVWIKLPDAISDPSSDTILMYYGNASLSDNSSIKDTFLIGDDFDDASLDTSIWTSNNNYSEADGVMKLWGTGSYSSSLKAVLPAANNPPMIIEFSFKLDNAASLMMLGTRWDGAYESSYHELDNGFGIKYHKAAGLHIIDEYISGSTNTLDSNSISLTVGQWYDYKYIDTSTNINGAIIGQDTVSANDASDYGNYIGIFSRYSGYETHYNDFRVRKYIANEPTPSYGTAQHQRRIPQFIG